MGNQKFHEGRPFTTPWFKAKHANSYVNGETTQTQNLIILKRQVRKQS
ncbi:YpzG family protein [Bacillus salipaludis]